MWHWAVNRPFSLRQFSIYLERMFLVYLFFSCLAVLGLRCFSARTFSKSQWVGAIRPFDVRPSHCSGFSWCRAQALGKWAQWCGTWAQSHLGMWDLLGPGIGPVSLALAGKFLSTAPLGESQKCMFLRIHFPGWWIQVCAYWGTLIIEHHAMCTYLSVYADGCIMKWGYVWFV